MQIVASFAWSRVKTLFATMVIITAISSMGCPHTVRPTGDEVVNCAKESGRDIFHTLIPRVSTIIATGPNYGTIAIELAKLTAEYGVGVVTCVVDTVRDRNMKAAAVATGDEKVLHQRSEAWAAQWIAEEGATMEHTQDQEESQ